VGQEPSFHDEGKDFRDRVLFLNGHVIETNGTFCDLVDVVKVGEAIMAVVIAGTG